MKHNKIKYLAWDKRNKEVIQVAGISNASFPEGLHDDVYSISFLRDNCVQWELACHYILMPYLGWEDVDGNPVHQYHVIESDGKRFELTNPCNCCYNFDKLTARIIGVIFN